MEPYAIIVICDGAVIYDVVPTVDVNTIMVPCHGVTRDDTGIGSPDLDANISVEYFLVLYSDIGAIYKNYLPCINIEYQVGFIIYIDKRFAIHRIIRHNIITNSILGNK